MRYYIAADVHGYFSELKTALHEQGFFEDTTPHKLILCGDLFDRGSEAKALQAFILDLMEQDEIILIRGNHEDLLLKFLYTLPQKGYLEYHHLLNGTVDTVCQLADVFEGRLLENRHSVVRQLLDGPLVQEIIPAMKNYYETEHYIFVHGWIPCDRQIGASGQSDYTYLPGWREADDPKWDQARWINGMEAAHNGVIEPGKTIVCGHWHCSFGHANYEGKGGEFDHDPDFSPYFAKGIIALDACTAQTRKVNCIRIDNE